MKRPEVKGKSLDEVIQDLKDRDVEYLTGTLEDLKAGLQDETIEVEEIEEVDDPTDTKVIEKVETPKPDKLEIRKAATEAAIADYKRFRDGFENS